MQPNTNHAILLISCPDQKGITAGITNFIFENGGNIVHADQHIDEQSNTFFMRVEWSWDEFKLSKDELPKSLETISKKFKMNAQLFFSDSKMRVAIFVSRRLHCLNDLLLRHKSGQFDCEISLIVSNHAQAQEVAQDFGIAFKEFVVTKENKKAQEKGQLKLLGEEKIDLIVLAQYHQIFTQQFIEAYPNKIINIHHSFLPAFAGQDPYGQAYRKGVKIIGATSHYVTAELDQGPVIEQDTVRVSHRDTLKDLVFKGEDLEKVVLSRALRWHLQHRILSFNNKTVIFD